MLARGHRLAAGLSPSLWCAYARKVHCLHSPVCRACCSFSKATSWARVSSWLLTSSNIFGLTTSRMKSERSGDENKHARKAVRIRAWQGPGGVDPTRCQPQGDEGKRRPSTAHLSKLSLCPCGWSSKQLFVIVLPGRPDLHLLLLK